MRVRLATYKSIKQRVIAAGYAKEIAWAENVKPVRKRSVFLCEYIWVVINSGMKNQVAAKIYPRVLAAVQAGQPVKTVYRHPGKAAAITYMCACISRRFREYQQAADKLAYLETLPWIGRITKYHLARNLGLDVCKPDRHLVRIAKHYGTTSQDLCARLSRLSGDRIGVVDVVLWRAANLRLI